MKVLGFYWGIFGVLAILLFAIFRLSFRIIDMLNQPLNILHWSVLVLFAIYMAYAEGYKGFHLNFSPRVIARARYFLEQNRSNTLSYIILAPIFCMGFIHATTKRKIVSMVLTSAIIVLVLLVRLLPQPWRGIVDVGVVIGLFIGVVSILYFWIQSLKVAWESPVAADFPLEAINQTN